MAADLSSIISAVRSFSSRAFKGRLPDRAGKEAQKSLPVKESKNDNFTHLGDMLVWSSGNITFDGKFHKAEFNDLRPGMKEALSFLIDHVF